MYINKGLYAKRKMYLNFSFIQLFYRLFTAATGSGRSGGDPMIPQLEAVRNYLSSYAETVGDFYSPMESPLGKRNDRRFCNLIW